MPKNQPGEAITMQPISPSNREHLLLAGGLSHTTKLVLKADLALQRKAAAPELPGAGLSKDTHEKVWIEGMAARHQAVWLQT